MAFGNEGGGEDMPQIHVDGSRLSGPGWGELTDERWQRTLEPSGWWYCLRMDM